jgi:hypothetical protein
MGASRTATRSRGRRIQPSQRRDQPEGDARMRRWMMVVGVAALLPMQASPARAATGRHPRTPHTVAVGHREVRRTADVRGNTLVRPARARRRAKGHAPGTARMTDRTLADAGRRVPAPRPRGHVPARPLIVHRHGGAGRGGPALAACLIQLPDPRRSTCTEGGVGTARVWCALPARPERGPPPPRASHAPRADLPPAAPVALRAALPRAPRPPSPFPPPRTAVMAIGPAPQPMSTGAPAPASSVGEGSETRFHSLRWRSLDASHPT